MVNGHTLALFHFGDAGEGTIAAPLSRLEWEVGYRCEDGRCYVAQRECVAEAVFDKNAMIRLLVIGVERRKAQNSRHRRVLSSIVTAQGMEFLMLDLGILSFSFVLSVWSAREQMNRGGKVFAFVRIDASNVPEMSQPNC